MMQEQAMNSEEMEGPEEQSPLDEAIAKVDSYIQDPKLVTTQTLTDLRQLLEEIRNGVDYEGDEREGMDEMHKEKPSMMSMVNKKRGGY